MRTSSTGKMSIPILMALVMGGSLFLLTLLTHDIAARTVTQTLRLPGVSFSSPGYSAGEETGAAAVTVTLDAAFELTATVDWATSNGTAIAGSDYLTASGRLTFAPGVKHQRFTVSLLDDLWDEADETLSLGLFNSISATITGTNPVTVTIIDDEPSGPFIRASDYDVARNQSILIHVLQHPPALNPYQLLWVRDGTAALEVISATLQVDNEGKKLGIPFVIPSDARGSYRLETRAVTGTVSWSPEIQVTVPDTDHLYLPLVKQRHVVGYTCPETSLNQYIGGTAFQVELDDPVRPAYNHADKNIELRSYSVNTNPGFIRGLVDYGSGDPTQPPQLATLFDPYRVPVLSSFYRVYNWVWEPTPNPGHRGDPINDTPVTALGMQTSPGETVRVPASGYDIGGGLEVLVLYADEDTVALRYTRDDSSGFGGYTVHIDNICTDPNLLALYNTLDDPDGPRYVYVDPGQRPYTYDLPNLPAGHPVGTAREEEIVVAIVDTGAFQDTRSCNEWWQIRPGYTGTCPPHE